MNTIETDGGFIRVSGTEADVCRLIAARQAIGIKKYGTTVADNPLSFRDWLMHSLEEKLDDCVYTLRAIQELDKQSDDGR